MFEGRWYSRDGRTAMKSATSLKGGITAECKSWLRAVLMVAWGPRASAVGAWSPLGCRW